MSEDRQAYYRRRAREERERAAAAVDDARVRGIHLELCARYEHLLGEQLTPPAGEAPD